MLRRCDYAGTAYVLPCTGYSIAERTGAHVLGLEPRPFVAPG